MYLQIPFPIGFVPVGMRHKMSELHLAADLVLRCNVVDVLVDLFPTGVVARPARVILKQECKAGCWNITRYSRVSIFEPYTSDICGMWTLVSKLVSKEKKNQREKT